MTLLRRSANYGFEAKVMRILQERKLRNYVELASKPPTIQPIYLREVSMPYRSNCMLLPTGSLYHPVDNSTRWASGWDGSNDKFCAISELPLLRGACHAPGSKRTAVRAVRRERRLRLATLGT